jgi:hypothetical protein
MKPISKFPTRTWRHQHLDKESWGPGPWVGEPDKVQWVDPSSGLDCLVVRSHHSSALCGYVGVPESHPCFGFAHDDPRIPDAVHAAVHRELTFAGLCEEGLPAPFGVCHTPFAGRPELVWWLGFDCAGAFDYRPTDALHEAYVDELYGAHDARRLRTLDDYGIDIDDPNRSIQGTYRTMRYVRGRVKKMAAALASPIESG